MPPTQALTNDGILVETLDGSDQARLQALRLTVPARRPAGAYASHAGSECMYVLSGTICLEVGQEARVLTVGDSTVFDTSNPHRVSALGDEDAVVLLVVSGEMP